MSVQDEVYVSFKCLVMIALQVLWVFSSTVGSSLGFVDSKKMASVSLTLILHVFVSMPFLVTCSVWSQSGREQSSVCAAFARLT